MGLCLLAGVLVVLFFLHYGKGAGKHRPDSGRLPSLAEINIRDASLDTVVEGLDQPWAMEFLAKDKLLITELAGTMKILDLANGQLKNVSGLPDIPSDERQIGLMDVVLHPDFSSNGLIYFSHAVRHEDGQERYATAISRAELHDNELSGLTRIVAGAPFTKSSGNFGGALAFGSDGHLYISMGDRSEGKYSQDTSSLIGKILRLTDNGDTPPDNPFVGDPATDERIYALGVRNPQGLVFDSLTGDLYESEHGPKGGDEINLIRAGANYGWPTITYGQKYKGGKIGVGTALPGLQQPLYFYLPSITASPIEIYRGAMFHEWEGNLLVGALKGEHISKLYLHNGSVISAKDILQEVKGRVRDIKVAADGSVYILQEKGRLYRLHRDNRQEKMETTEQASGQMIYETVCASCHDAGLGQVPALEDTAGWTPRIVQGRELLIRHAIDGYRLMPEKGLCEACSEEEIVAAVDYMLGKMAKTD